LAIVHIALSPSSPFNVPMDSHATFLAHFHAERLRRVVSWVATARDQRGWSTKKLPPNRPRETPLGTHTRLPEFLPFGAIEQHDLPVEYFLRFLGAISRPR